MRRLLAFCLMVFALSPALADKEIAASSQAPEVEVFLRIPLAKGTPVRLVLVETVTTKGHAARKGDRVRLKVARPVTIGNYVAIQSGTPAFGHVTMASAPGAFGKSGKIELEVDYLVLAERRIGLTGLHRAQGRGELTTIGSIAAAGPFAPFISGENGALERGTELTAYLSEPVGIAIPYQPELHARYSAQAVVFRARKIAVAEAFDDAFLAVEDDGQSPGSEEPSFDQAFEDEFRAIKDEP